MTKCNGMPLAQKAACAMLYALALCITLCSCDLIKTQDKNATKGTTSSDTDAQLLDAPPKLYVYEKLDESSARWQIDPQNLAFDLGHKQADKYLEDLNSPWAEPEFITAERAQKEGLSWAKDRWLRWLEGTTATFHFHYTPTEEVEGYTLELALRPKVNDSMRVMFYRLDKEKGEMAWSTPQTIALKPGWAAYKIPIAKEMLDPSGSQLLRIQFPNAYFDGDKRVSAKFVRLSFAPSSGEAKASVGDIEALPVGLEQVKANVLGQERQAWGLIEGKQMQRFLILPAEPRLSFDLAPGHWLTEKGRFVVEVTSDEEQSQVVADIAIQPGTEWTKHVVDLSNYAQTGVRLRLAFFENDDNNDFLVQKNDYRPKAFLANPEILNAKNSTDAQIIDQLKTDTKRIVILAIDNLRADRLFAMNQRRATPGMSALFDRSSHGLAMGESLSQVATAVSFLSTQSSQVHQVRDTTTHLRTSQTTIAEAGQEQGWTSHFFINSSALDPIKGMAQGFATKRLLMQEGFGQDTQKTLQAVSESLSQAPDKSLYFVHLSELRLPYRTDAKTLESWGVANYTGPINEEAMQNVTILRNPTPQDAAQLQAYYDGELAGIDAAIAEFVDNLPQDCLLLVFSTHANSLSEGTLGYEQSLSPWESILPYFFYHPKNQKSQKLDGIATMASLSAAILDIMGAAIPANVHSVFESYASRARAQHDGTLATASPLVFFRMRREGIDLMLPWSIENMEQNELNAAEYPILRRALREQLVQ